MNMFIMFTSSTSLMNMFMMFTSSMFMFTSLMNMFMMFTSPMTILFNFLMTMSMTPTSPMTMATNALHRSHEGKARDDRHDPHQPPHPVLLQLVPVENLKEGDAEERSSRQTLEQRHDQHVRTSRRVHALRHKDPYHNSHGGHQAQNSHVGHYLNLLTSGGDHLHPDTEEYGRGVDGDGEEELPDSGLCLLEAHSHPFEHAVHGQGHHHEEAPQGGHQPLLHLHVGHHILHLHVRHHLLQLRGLHRGDDGGGGVVEGGHVLQFAHLGFESFVEGQLGVECGHRTQLRRGAHWSAVRPRANLIVLVVVNLLLHVVVRAVLLRAGFVLHVQLHHISLGLVVGVAAALVDQGLHQEDEEEAGADEDFGGGVVVAGGYSEVGGSGQGLAHLGQDVDEYCGEEDTSSNAKDDSYQLVHQPGIDLPEPNRDV